MNRAFSHDLAQLNKQAAGTPLVTQFEDTAIAQNNVNNTVSGIVGAWMFTEGTGLVSNDAAPLGQKVTFTASHFPVWKPGKFNAPCLYFGGSASVSTAVQKRYFLEYGGSMVLWLNTDVSNDGSFHCAVMQDNTYKLYLKDSGVMGLYTGAGFGVNGSTVLSTGRWYQVVATWDKVANKSVLYINGKQDATGTWTNAGSTNGQMWIGQNNVGGSEQYFQGYIDHVMLFYGVLTASAIEKLYVEPFYMFGPTRLNKAYESVAPTGFARAFPVIMG